MKKVLLAVLCAGLFFACGNKKQAEPETLVDTTVAECVEEVIEEAEPVVEEPAVAENTTPAKKTTTTPKKNTTTNNTGMQAASKDAPAPTVQQQAENAANRVAGKAIEKAENEATEKIVNSGKKRR